MVDLQTICCMCGDVGFPDKLFRCNKCRYRFQHSQITGYASPRSTIQQPQPSIMLSYCSNYYGEFAQPIELCDWCQSEERNSRQGSSSKKSFAGNETGIISRSEYSGDKIKQHDRDESGYHPKGKSSGTPSPRPTTRRYKLLKDVMC